MSDKKKYDADVKFRLRKEIERYVTQKEFLKEVSELLGIPYSSVRIWLSLDVDRAPGLNLLIAAANRWPMLNWQYIFTGRVMNVINEQRIVSEHAAPKYGVEEDTDYKAKYINCMEKNAQLTEQLLKIHNDK